MIRLPRGARGELDEVKAKFALDPTLQTRDASMKSLLSIADSRILCSVLSADSSICVAHASIRSQRNT